MRGNSPRPRRSARPRGRGSGGGLRPLGTSARGGCRDPRSPGRRFRVAPRPPRRCHGSAPRRRSARRSTPAGRSLRPASRAARWLRRGGARRTPQGRQQDQQGRNAVGADGHVRARMDADGGQHGQRHAIPAARHRIGFGESGPDRRRQADGGMGDGGRLMAGGAVRRQQEVRQARPCRDGDIAGAACAKGAGEGCPPADGPGDAPEEDRDGPRPGVPIRPKTARNGRASGGATPSWRHPDWGGIRAPSGRERPSKRSPRVDRSDSPSRRAGNGSSLTPWPQNGAPPDAAVTASAA